MSVWAVEGGAGVGKTYRLIERLGEVLREQPLTDQQRVLALTFMHGSRRRLDDRLRQFNATLAFGFDCLTVDSFAYRLLRRWSALATANGIPSLSPSEYEAQCGAAAQLLERENVRAWVVARYPIVVLDEAQDLGPERLLIVQRLSMLATTLVAADEFQCLETALRPSLAVQWLHTASQPEVLTGSRRTNSAGILNAASALRTGTQVGNGSGFRLVASKGKHYFAAATLAGEISSNPGGNLAVIAPSRSQFVAETVERVRSVACGVAKLGPYTVNWETSQDAVADNLIATLQLNETNAYDVLLHVLVEQRENWIAREVTAWIRRQRAIHGREIFARAEFESAVRSIVGRGTRYARNAPSGRHAMTIHQAKNREFDVVVVLWPYQVVGDAEQKRRLLYNAVTRAGRRCTVIVQNESMLLRAPFA